jgi:hypothetical protein
MYAIADKSFLTKRVVHFPVTVSQSGASMTERVFASGCARMQAARLTRVNPLDRPLTSSTMQDIVDHMQCHALIA